MDTKTRMVRSILVVIVLFSIQIYSYSFKKVSIGPYLTQFYRKRSRNFFVPLTSKRLHSQSLLMTINRRIAAPSSPVMDTSFILRQILLVPLMILSSIGAKICVKRWLQVGAGKKLGGISFTIPIISGLVNMTTNKISVWMIFNPLEYTGREFVKRTEGSPAGFLGWSALIYSLLLD